MQKRTHPVNYTVQNEDRDNEGDIAQKNIKEERVSHQVKFQMQEYQKGLILIQTLWNIAYGQCSESFQLALTKKGTELGE